MTSPCRLDIVIVGAGLAGLSAAIACALAGHAVTVLEGAKQLAEIGAGLQITPNASKILLKWGLESKLADTWAVPTTCSVRRYSDGKILAHEAGFRANNIRKYGAPFAEMHRVDMQRILYDKATELGVEVRLAQRVASVDYDRNRPQVILQDSSVVEGDLIVGADGLWSRCRESLLGHADHPLPTGDLAYRIVLTLDQIQDDQLKELVKSPVLNFWAGPKSHAVGYSVRAGNMYNLVLLCPDDLPDQVSRQHASVDEMQALFATFGYKDPIFTKLLNCVEKVDKWKLMHRAELPTWTSPRKNFVLVGDSCHPMLPYLAQGANSSIEDGAVLGRTLSHIKLREQLPFAVELYEKLRKTRSEAIVRETFLQRNDFHLEDGPEQAARDQLFASELGKDEATVKFPSRWTCPVVQPWLYGYDAYQETDNAVLGESQLQNGKP